MVDMTEDRLQLPYGMTWGLVPGIKAAWGARLIYPDDLVWDRQGTAGDEVLAKKTVAWLNEKDEDVSKYWGFDSPRTRFGCALHKARTLADSHEMEGNDERGFVLYQDGKGAIIASPNRSYGYLYVAAYLYEALPGGHCTPSFDGTEIARNKTINNYNKEL